jgi:hypothetical protein
MDHQAQMKDQRNTQTFLSICKNRSNATLDIFEKPLQQIFEHLFRQPLYAILTQDIGPCEQGCAAFRTN